ncbi:15607_t:CDS:2 [Funneliformis geosporum]|uniref:224_t:CDS:1 n=1 Tax=Funneliformis geosporum TaxID=1117311 RepID=A0A9W4SRU7_9GLOM|nr:15607_t:CDS:2 [Funneliformis geosporum]CAI2176864.1 224_t:CDS:2 [Funneliformis geosporum]
MKFNLLFATACVALFSNGVIAQTTNTPPGDAIKSPGPAQICAQNRAFAPSDGTQNKNDNAKVCVSTVIGQLPAVNKMVSSIIIKPKNGAVIKRNTPFEFAVKSINLDTGFFSDPNFDYYDAPQQLNAQGVIQGHNHVTIQKLKGNQVPDARIFAFFKGLNDEDNNGVLTQQVENGLPQVGTYRICTMSSSFTHQAVIMPVAQRDIRNKGIDN